MNMEQKESTKKVEEGQLAEELEEMMKDFFVANVSRKDNTVYVRFLNGQTFAMKAEEVTGKE